MTGDGMLTKYKTILKEGFAESVEKKSRFLSTVRPVRDEAEAKQFIEEMKKKYWNASHNVFAYQLGERNEIQRFSDDGEPQGTAGLPVLDVLRGEDVKNTAVVVTRYFGGTLLGTGGLVRAYGHAAKNGLMDAGIAEMILYHRYSVKTDYTMSGKIQYELLQGGHIIEDTLYTDMVEYRVLVEYPLEDAFMSAVTEASGAKANIVKNGEQYGAWTDGVLSMVE